MREETVLAFDFGEKRIGVAIGNSVTGSARALTTLKPRDGDDRFAQISQLLREWAPTRLVVGLPQHPDGTAHEMTQRCRRFANQLQGRFGLPVVMVDERYSSVEAEALLGAAARGAAIDAEAARVILQQYLDEQTP
jgi:putative Holliday junction resolvase